MKRQVFLNRVVMLTTVPLALISCLSLEGQPRKASIVTVSPGDNIQSAVDAAPEGTTFVLHPGVYRKQSVKPKDRDIFKGEGGAILNGSEVLSFEPATVGGRHLWVANASGSNFVHGRCQSGYPLCGYAQDLFIDNVLQAPVGSQQGVMPGSWFFDRSNNKVYIPDSPAGHTVELGMQQYAFYGNASNVQISNVIVEKYATPAQYGAVGGDASGAGWLVNSVESRWNHGAGISLGSGSQLSNSSIHHNGQLGIALHGTNSRAIHNEIAWNNYARFDMGWEAGGSKFSRTTNLLVQSNNIHDNRGPGLWTDIDNVNTLYENNTVTNNLAEGIVHEISYKAAIRYNVVKGNGNASTVWLWNAQIAIQNSSNVEVYGNTVEVPPEGGNGIVVINQKRGSGTMGAWVATNNYIHNNSITYLGPHGISGIADDTGANAAVGNKFDYNTYTFPKGNGKHWQWFKGQDWSGLQTVGQEAHGQQQSH